MSFRRPLGQVLARAWVGLLAIVAAVGIGAGCQSCASGATLRVSVTAPAQDNDGTCAAPVLVAQPGALRVIHFRWVGPAAGEDSTVAVAGATASLVRAVTPGAYSVYAWASDAGGAGCMDSIRVTVKAPPHRVTFQ